MKGDYFNKWTGHFVTAKELDGVYERCVAAFNKACDEIEKQEDEAKIRQLIGDTLGHRTYMIEEPSSLSEGRR